MISKKIYTAQAIIAATTFSSKTGKNYYFSTLHNSVVWFYSDNLSRFSVPCEPERAINIRVDVHTLRSVVLPIDDKTKTLTIMGKKHHYKSIIASTQGLSEVDKTQHWFKYRGVFVVWQYIATNEYFSPACEPNDAIAIRVSVLSFRNAILPYTKGN